MKKKELFRVVLVHTARTWERLRLEQTHKEMPLDNIESVDAIIEVSDKIMKVDILKRFITEPQADYFITHTGMLSDTYIETLAKKIIKKRFLK